MLYCLTNNGELGKINEEIDNKLIIYKLNKKEKSYIMVTVLLH